MVSALQTYEHYIIGSPFPIYLYCDHKPILYLWGRKGQLSPLLPISNYYNEISKSQDYLDSRVESCFPGHPQSKCNSRGVPDASVKTQENT